MTRVFLSLTPALILRLTTYAVFTLGIFTAVKEFTYLGDLGKFLVNVNIN